jgi:peroxiredoxin
MKKIIALSILAFAMLSCSSEQFRINGNIEGAEEQKVYLMQVVNNELVPIDSTTLKNGKFSFKGEVPFPDLYAIEFSSLSDRIVLFLENSEINIAGNSNELGSSTITGSASHDILLDFNRLAEENSQQLMDINFRYQSAAMDGILTSTLEEELKNEYIEESKKLVDFIKKFVADNNQSAVAAYITLVHLIDHLELNELEAIVTSFPTLIQSSPFVAALKDHISIEKRTSIGESYTDFTLPNQSGNEVSFSTFVGKNYILLDFWAGWCAPCRKENPHLVEVYNKFKSKGFDIFGVSLDQNRDQWFNAIETDGLLWTQVSDLKGWDSPIAKLYGIMSIPANLLISPKGEIVAKNLRGNELEAKLEELLK